MLKAQIAFLPTVPVWREGDLLVFDRKFFDGMSLYAKLWPGEVTCIITASNSIPPSFGLVKTNVFPFKCIVLKEGELINQCHLDGISIVAASGDSHEQFHLSKLCKAKNIKCVYSIEYTLETRFQMVSLTTNNPIIKLRRLFYVWAGERKRLNAFSLCDGLQVNGAAAYYEYKHYQNTLLYFDSRTNKEDFIENEHLLDRLETLQQNKPLRLAFSGRITRIKGTDHLVQLANKLKQKKIDFVLTIYGNGDLVNEMQRYIEKHDLSNYVFMKGAIDFHKELLPKIKNETDLFVCLHRQGDPSCTYLETLSCGVPIVGYENKAFTGILERADVGWGQKLDSLDGIVNIIEYLDKNRSEIAEKAMRSLEFASHHDFETTFQNRIKHLYNTIENNTG